MNKIYSLVLLAFLGVLGVQAQNVITSVDQTYSQNFNTLATTGTSNSFGLENWESNRVIYIASDGQSATGALYSFGATSSSDRALGSLNSGSTPKIYFGTSFQNNSGEELSKIAVSYKGEQWRVGAKNIGNGVRVPDTLLFQYSLDASGASDSLANWVTVEELSFISPVTTESEKKLDGNASSNSKNVSGELNVVVPAGATLTIRWSNERSTVGVFASRDGLGIDDLTVTFGEGGEVEPEEPECDFDVEEPATITKLENDLNSAYIEFKPVSGAIGYLITLDDVYYQDHEFGIPEDGVSYEVGDFLFDTEVVGIITETSFSISDLWEDSYYFLTVFPIFECDGEIFYGYEEYVEFYTTPACDVAEWISTKFNTITPGSTSASIELLPIVEAVGYIVTIDPIDVDDSYEYGDPIFGEEYATGDYINDTRVAYVGSSPSFTIDGLNPETDYLVLAYPIFECDDDIIYGYYNYAEFTTTSVSTAIKGNISKDMLIYPNPVAGNVLNVRLDAAAQGKANIQIHNVLGAQVYATQATISSENQIVLPSKLAAGRYSISIEQNGKVQVGSFIVIQ